LHAVRVLCCSVAIIHADFFARIYNLERLTRV